MSARFFNTLKGFTDFCGPLTYQHVRPPSDRSSNNISPVIKGWRDGCWDRHIFVGSRPTEVPTIFTLFRIRELHVVRAKAQTFPPRIYLFFHWMIRKVPPIHAHIALNASEQWRRRRSWRSHGALATGTA